MSVLAEQKVYAEDASDDDVLQSLQSLQDDELSFVGAHAKITDVHELRKHVQETFRDFAQNSTAHQYRCIKSLTFLLPRIQLHPAYERAMQYRDAEDGVFMDIGCCFGNDVRQVILDGWPQDKIRAVDVTYEYWNYGLRLFKDESVLSVRPYVGNILSDDGFRSQFSNSASVIWAGSVLHVFNEEDVTMFVTAVYSMLKPNGLFFGSCVGLHSPGPWRPSDSAAVRYLHSAESLRHLFERLGFQRVEVADRARMVHDKRIHRIQQSMKDWDVRNPELIGKRTHLVFSACKPPVQVE